MICLRVGWLNSGGSSFISEVNNLGPATLIENFDEFLKSAKVTWAHV
jgi:hypothetical protein